MQKRTNESLAGGSCCIEQAAHFPVVVVCCRVRVKGLQRHRVLTLTMLNATDCSNPLDLVSKGSVVLADGSCCTQHA